MMMMTPRIRKLALTTHVTSAVGWLGAVAAFLALSIAGLNSGEDRTMRAAYVAMQLVTWAVIVPLSLASLLTGIVQSLGTPWGLFRHYWVVAKLAIAVVASILLLLHTQPIEAMSTAAVGGVLSVTDFRQLRIRLVADAVAALAALVAATTLSVYKPQGLTAYGRRTLQGGALASDAREAAGTSLWRYLAWTIAIIVLVLFVLRHVTGGGMSH